MTIPLSILKQQAALLAQVDTGDVVSMDKIEDAIKREYKKRWREYFWNEVTVIDKAIAVASGDDFILVPKDIEIVISLTERTNKAILKRNNLRMFQIDHLLSYASANVPYVYAKDGTTPLKIQPSAAGILKLSSDSASDTNIQVRVRGQDANGNQRTELISLNGTSEISGSVTFAASSITTVSKNALSVGTITIKDASDNTLDTIAPRDYNNKYDRLKLAGPTDKAYTVYLTGKLRFKQYEYDEDTAIFDIDEALKLMGVAAIYKDRGDSLRSREFMFEAQNYVDSIVKEKFVFSDDREDTQPELGLSDFDKPFLSGLG